LTLKATKRTQNATGAVVKDNGFIVGLNPEAGSPEGWHWRYPISSLVGSDYGAKLNTTLKEPKITPFYLLKISPLIRTAAT